MGELEIEHLLDFNNLTISLSHMDSSIKTLKYNVFSLNLVFEVFMKINKRKAKKFTLEF